MSTVTQSRKHVFAHLGQAPYKLVDYYEAQTFADYENGILPPNFQQACCDHCGTPLKHVFVCESADGKRFNLGSVHVERLGDSGLTKAVKTKVREVRREAQEAKRQAVWEAGREAREVARREQEAKAAAEYDNRLAEIERVLSLLAAEPHPNAFFAKRGKTKLDYFYFFVDQLSYGDVTTSVARLERAITFNRKATQIIREAGATFRCAPQPKF